MRLALLGNPEAEELIVFFAGWAMDERPFRRLGEKNTAVALIYDYRDLELPEIPQGYSRVYVLAWSLGVCAALKNPSALEGEILCLAGTGAFSHPVFGIHPRMINLTLKGLEERREKSLLAFYANMFSGEPGFDLFLENRPQRPLSEIIEELRIAFAGKPLFPSNLERVRALCTSKDRIVPFEAQVRYWERVRVPMRVFETGHFPFYSLASLKELFF